MLLLLLYSILYYIVSRLRMENMRKGKEKYYHVENETENICGMVECCLLLCRLFFVFFLCIPLSFLKNNMCTDTYDWMWSKTVDKWHKIIWILERISRFLSRIRDWCFKKSARFPEFSKEFFFEISLITWLEPWVEIVICLFPHIDVRL